MAMIFIFASFITIGLFLSQYSDISYFLLVLSGLAFVVAVIQMIRILYVTRSSEGASEKRCSKCGGEMVLLIAKNGSEAGSQFWGCSNYPRCG